MSSTIAPSAAEPDTRTITLCLDEDSLTGTTAQRKHDNVAITSLSEAAPHEALELSRYCSSGSHGSPLELMSLTRQCGSQRAGGGSSSSTSGGPLNNTYLPLSNSSRGLDSTAFTDDVADDDDDGSVGSCAAHEAKVTAGDAKDDVKEVACTCVATFISSSPSSPSASAAASKQRQAHAASTASRPQPFSSLAMSSMSWGAMRKLRLESAQNNPRGARNNTGDMAEGDMRRRLNRSAHSSDHQHLPPSTLATFAGFLSSSSGPVQQVESAMHSGVHEGACGNAAAQLLGGTHDNASVNHVSSGSTVTGYWTLAPRLRGVNEVLLSTHHAQLFREALDALHVWNTAVHLDLHDNSAGGTYMVRLAVAATAADALSSPRAVLCVFKPRDEEIGQETNPHGNRESDRVEAFAPGSGSRREVLAYRLDHRHNAGVPPTIEVASGYVGTATACNIPSLGAGTVPKTTEASSSGLHDDDAVANFVGSPAGLSDLSTRTLGTTGVGVGVRQGGGVEADAMPWNSNNNADKGQVASTMPQIGSLQLFVPGCQEAADVLPGRFSTEEVHGLAIFDIRTLNGDRHGGNVLVQHYYRSQRGSNEAQPNSEEAPHLIPIDHSYICPSGYADPDYEWLSWPQAKQPFSPSSLQYIAALDAEADAELVRSALLAHNTVCSSNNSDITSSMAAAVGASGGNGGADVYEVSDCTAYHELNHTHPAFAAAAGLPSSGECAGERTRDAPRQLDDDVRRARAVAQECGVPLDFPICDSASLSLHGCPCESFTNLTIFSPVLSVHQPKQTHSRSSGPSHRDSDAEAAEAADNDFDSPRKCSMTVPPELNGAARCDRWAESTAQLLDSCYHNDNNNGDAVKMRRDKEADEEEQREGDDIDRTRNGRCSCPRCAATVQASATPSSLFFPSREVDSVAENHAEGSTAAVVVTYDKGAANAAAEVMRCTTRLLQVAALEFHLTAYEIGSLCRRPRIAQASFLEEVMEEARDELSWEVAPSTFDSLVRQRLASLAKK